MDRMVINDPDIPVPLLPAVQDFLNHLSENAFAEWVIKEEHVVIGVPREVCGVLPVAVDIQVQPVRPPVGIPTPWRTSCTSPFHSPHPEGSSPERSDIKQAKIQPVGPLPNVISHVFSPALPAVKGLG